MSTFEDNSDEKSNTNSDINSNNDINITDSDNQGKVPNGSIIDRDNQPSLSLIITDNQALFTTSLPTFPSLPMIHRTKQMTGYKSNIG